MRVVVDTNVLISSLISKGGSPDRLAQLWREKRFELVISEWQLEEFRRVSRYKQVRKRLKPAEAGRMVNGLRQHALVIDELPEVDYSPDPDDNPIIAAALAGQAQYIVSGDKKDVLALEVIEGVQVVSVHEFISLF